MGMRRPFAWPATAGLPSEKGSPAAPTAEVAVAVSRESEASMVIVHAISGPATRVNPSRALHPAGSISAGAVPSPFGSNGFEVLGSDFPDVAFVGGPYRRHLLRSR